MSTRGFLKEARMRLEEVAAQRERLTKELESVRRLEESLRTILAAYGSPADAKIRPAGRSVASDTPLSAAVSAQERPTTLSPLVEQIERVLRDAGEPIHFKEIAERLLKSGVRVPGMNPANNVSAHLSRHKELFERVGGRGMWGLKTPEVSPDPRTRSEQADVTDSTPFSDEFDVSTFTQMDEDRYGPDYGLVERDVCVV